MNPIELPVSVIFLTTEATAYLSQHIVRNIKANSSRFINEKQWIIGKFERQTGFRAFSCGYSQLTTVVQYIQKQEIHHEKRTFNEEYVDFLQSSGIDYDEKYIFE